MSVSKSRLRVLHGPANVGNQAWTLSRAERAQGFASDLVVNHDNWLHYPADRTLAQRGESRWSGLARRVAFGVTAPFRYDVLHYYFGSSYLFWDYNSPNVPVALDFLRYADVQIARQLGRSIFLTLQGCDIRLAGESNRINVVTPCAKGRCPVFSTCTSSLDDARRRMRDTLLPLIDRVFFLNPELGRYLPNAEFLPYASADIRGEVVTLPDPNRPPRIVHAPSHGDIKGTPRILEALEALKSRYDFELVLIQNLPHAEAMAMYRSADLAIDQLYAGWYGGFAVEVMAMGKPVAAYIRENDSEFVPRLMWESMPIQRISPESLETDLANILDRRADWPAIGAASRRYVLDWHDPGMLAAALAPIYRDRKAALLLGPGRAQ
jgi:glycosyltransferase involved in cell wall biosynthesis